MVLLSVIIHLIRGITGNDENLWRKTTSGCDKVANVTTLSKDSSEYYFSVMSLSLVVKPVILELSLCFGDTASSH